MQGFKFVAGVADTMIKAETPCCLVVLGFGGHVWRMSPLQFLRESGAGAKFSLFVSLALGNNLWIHLQSPA